MVLAVVLLGSTKAVAQNETLEVPVKMTYVDYNSPDEAVGEVETIEVGFNKVPSVGSTIQFGNTGWGENKIGVLKVDVSAVPGVIQKATLKAQISGSTDSKSKTNWGLALTDNEWSAFQFYTVVKEWTVSAMLDNGKQVSSTTTSATDFDDASWDVTDAFSSGQQKATILVYETVAGGGYMKDVVVEVEYVPYVATTTKYDFEDGNVVFQNGTNSGNGRITAAIEYNEALASKVLGWTCSKNAQNGYSFSYYDFTSLLNNPALVKIDFDYYNTKDDRAVLTIGDALVRGTDGKCSTRTYSNTGAIFSIGSDKNYAFINDISLPQDDRVTETYTKYGLCGKWLHVALVVNNDTRTVWWKVTL